MRQSHKGFVFLLVAMTACVGGLPDDPLDPPGDPEEPSPGPSQPAPPPTTGPGTTPTPPTTPGDDTAPPSNEAPCTPGETRACWPFDDVTRGRGACHDGTQTCSGDVEFGAWSPCEGAVGPSTEAEGNGIDEDCSGDEDLACWNGMCCPAGQEPVFQNLDNMGTNSVLDGTKLVGCAPNVCGAGQVQLTGDPRCVSPPPACGSGSPVFQYGAWTCQSCALIIRFGGPDFGDGFACTSLPPTCGGSEWDADQALFNFDSRSWECVSWEECTHFDGKPYHPYWVNGRQMCIPC